MMATQKCVHKGCGKKFTDPEEDCVYHSGPPVFHEGQKGWQCCKPRVLTFDEFLAIPPCTTGKHSTVDDTPAPVSAPSKAAAEDIPAPKPVSAEQPVATPPLGRQPQTQKAQQQSQAPALPPESESDDPSLTIPAGAKCRRRACESKYQGPNASRGDEQCVHHPGHPIFHEGSKGYTCCKRRVLEFDEFMKIEGCKTKDRHMFVGSGKKKENKVGGAEELLESVRHDFYQTSSTLIASIYLKKIIQPTAKDTDRVASITFPDSNSIALDLPTADNKRYRADWSLFSAINPEKSTWKIMGTKVELELAKANPGEGWPVLKADEKPTGEIIQTGQAGRA